MSAFDDPEMQKAGAKFAFQQAQENPELAKKVGAQVANAYMDNAYSQPDPNSGDINRSKHQNAPPDKSAINDAKAAGGSCSRRMPLRILTVMVGVAYLTTGILCFFLPGSLGNADIDNGAGTLTPSTEPDKTFLRIFVNLFCILGGAISLIVEFPRMFWNKRMQKFVFYWALFMSRLWGRAWTYLFLAILTISAQHWLRVVVGCFTIFVCIIMYFVGLTSSKKINRISVFVAAGAEKDQRLERVDAKFKELDVLNRGFLTATEVQHLGAQAGRELSHAEVQIIMRFFDPENHDELHYDAWIRGFKELENPGVSSL